MHSSTFFTTAALLVSSTVAQQTDCSQLQSGYGYICANGGTEVHYCQASKSPKEVTSQYCGQGDCLANGDQGFCANGITEQNRARGPTDCSQVFIAQPYICSEDYKTLYQCSGQDKVQADYCPDASCFASTTGDQGVCVGNQ